MLEKIFVFAGRMQVPHIGHQTLIKKCLEEAKSTHGLAKILQIDSEYNSQNPHSSQQIKKMLEIIFPHEIKSGQLSLTTLSSLETGNIQNIETWNSLSGGKIKKICVIFGKKQNSKAEHPLEYLAKIHAFDSMAITAKIRKNVPQGYVSTSEILQNPYASYVPDVVDHKIIRYLSGLWQRAYEENCFVHEVDPEPDFSASVRFQKSLRETGQVLIINEEGKIEKINVKSII